MQAALVISHGGLSLSLIARTSSAQPCAAGKALLLQEDHAARTFAPEFWFVQSRGFPTRCMMASTSAIWTSLKDGLSRAWSSRSPAAEASRQTDLSRLSEGDQQLAMTLLLSGKGSSSPSGMSEDEKLAMALSLSAESSTGSSATVPDDSSSRREAELKATVNASLRDVLLTPKPADRDPDPLPVSPSGPSARATRHRASLWEPEDEIQGSSQSVEEAAIPSVVVSEPPVELPSVEESKHTMATKGWCSHQVDYLAKLHDEEVLSRFAHIDRRIHRPEDHNACSEHQRCIAYNSPPEDRYYPTHASSCSGHDCYTVKVPEHELVSIVQSGGVPLVSIHESKTHELSFRVHRRGFRNHYATVSHVWADGLGNTIENALPVCQVKQLKTALDWFGNNDSRAINENDNASFGTAVRRVDDFIFRTRARKLLWMDTLCIPITTRPDQQELRDQCIDAMASIYAGSSVVFVFDKELMALESPASPQILYNIASSVWMCRSWTLQEAILPGQCVFRLKHCYYRPTDDIKPSDDDMLARYMCRELFYVRNLWPKHSWSRFLGRQLSRIGKGFIGPQHSADRLDSKERLDTLISTWNSLAGRGTTKAEDLYVVLASCLGFKLRQFRTSQSLDDKMQRIFLSFNVLPFSLFLNDGPNSTANGDHNRWIPLRVSSHLLSSTSTFTLPDPNISKFSDEGMRAKVDPGPEMWVIITSGGTTKFEPFMICCEDRTYLTTPIPDPEDTTKITDRAQMCIVIDARAQACDAYRGACFVIASSQQPSQGERIELIYRYPVDMISLEDAQIKKQKPNIERLVGRTSTRNTEY